MNSLGLCLEQHIQELRNTCRHLRGTSICQVMLGIQWHLSKGVLANEAQLGSSFPPTLSSGQETMCCVPTCMHIHILLGAVCCTFPCKIVCQCSGSWGTRERCPSLRASWLLPGLETCSHPNKHLPIIKVWRR